MEPAFVRDGDTWNDKPGSIANVAVRTWAAASKERVEESTQAAATTDRQRRIRLL